MKYFFLGVAWKSLLMAWITSHGGKIDPAVQYRTMGLALLVALAFVIRDWGKS